MCKLWHHSPFWGNYSSCCTSAQESLPLAMWWGRAQRWMRCHCHQEQTPMCTWPYPAGYVHVHVPASLPARSPAVRAQEKQSINRWHHILLGSLIQDEIISCLGLTNVWSKENRWRCWDDRGKTQTRTKATQLWQHPNHSGSKSHFFKACFGCLESMLYIKTELNTVVGLFS